MRQETINIYTFNELSKEAQENAIENWREHKQYDNYYIEELLKSLTGLIDHCNNVKIIDYSIGLNGSYLRVGFVEGDDNNELSDSADTDAMQWLEDNLLANIKDKEGKTKECPFTGCYYDDYLLEDLIESVKNGYELIDCFNGLADTCEQILQKEYDFLNSDECISETLIANEYEFLEDGKMYF